MGDQREGEGCYLSPAIVCEFDAVIGYELVDFAVLVALALGVADDDEELQCLSAVERRYE